MAGIENSHVRLPAGVRDYLPRAAARRRGIAEALAAIGRGDATLDVGEVGPLKEALAALPEAARAEARTLIGKKDRRGVERLVAAARVPARARKLLVALPTLYGDGAVIREA